MTDWQHGALSVAIGVGLYYALLWFIPRRTRLQRRHVFQRSEAHEAYLAFLEDILGDPEVTSVLVKHRAATQEGLLGLRATLGEMPEPMLRKAGAALLNDRTVRRQIVSHLASTRGMDKGKLMRELGDMVMEARG